MARLTNRFFAAILVTPFALGPGTQAGLADTSACLAHSANPGNQSELIRVSAEIVTVTGGKNTVLLTGNPVLTQADLCLSANRILATYSPESGKLVTISAYEDVSFFRGSDHATSGVSHYDVETRVLVLEGNVTLTREGSTIAADEVTLNLDNETVTFSGNVSSVINPVSGE
ncbi:MAG: hypothetical protein OXF88_24725 [Rhodobacteraceae bacterium]|nr:hypothetical protein [Paracoccaceae bacterium]MCY4141410.1 hypothetical protein [Paracoccaceae bacterium]